MVRAIGQRELRNDSGAIMRALDEGEHFLVTRNGVPVGELHPARRRFASRERFREVLHAAPHIDEDCFRADLDEVVDQTVEIDW